MVSRNKSTAEFVRDAVVVHADRYDYSRTIYVNNKTKVLIACEKHGQFEQTPGNHLSGYGCKLCGFENAGQYHKKDTGKFIAAAKKIQGEKYDYSATKYIGARERLTVICPIHGPFEQIATVHLRGAGCELCSYIERGTQSRISFEEFISRAIVVHNGFYEYELSREHFKDTTTEIPITCPEHGVFEQSPSGHLQGRGCPKCRYVTTGASLRKTNTSFIQDARLVHGDVYDYSRTEYKGAFDAVTIICPIDGPFIQSPTSHLAGTGCPKCSRRGQGAPRNLVRALRGEFDMAKEAFVYLVRFHLPCSDAQLFKVGSGSGTRLKTVVASIKRVGGTDVDITSISLDTSGEAIVYEHLAQGQVVEHQFPVPTEFKFPGYSEVFSKEPDLIAVEAHPTLKRFRLGDRWDPRIS